MNIDIISDIHIDTWIKYKPNLHLIKQDIEDFVRKLIPTNKSNTLIIAGDLGHSNDLNLLFLVKIKKYYDNILIVAGNHDKYLVTSDIEKKYKYNSDIRLYEMMGMAEEIDGIKYLDGTAITIDGITFGGSGMWYDGYYGVKNYGYDMNMINQIWEKTINDAHYIKPRPDIIKTYEIERKKLLSIYQDCDLIITHVAPDIPDEFKNPVSSFFHFDGEEFIKNNNRTKLWIFGHTHHSHDFMVGNMRFVCNPLGYGINGNEIRIIKTVNV